MGGIAPKGRTGPEAVPLPDGHLAGAAVETEFEAAAVVEEEERAGVLCPLETGAEAEFEADAVFAAHQFGSGGVGQFIGGILAAAVLYAITTATSGSILGTTTGANACADGVPLGAGFLVEAVLTTLFVLVVLGATAKTNGATNNFAGLAIGLSLTLIHLVGIHYTGTSVNPARSLGPALFQGGAALSQLWIFIVAPLLGGALAAAIWKAIEPKAGKA